MKINFVRTVPNNTIKEKLFLLEADKAQAQRNITYLRTQALGQLRNVTDGEERDLADLFESDLRVSKISLAQLVEYYQDLNIDPAHIQIKFEEVWDEVTKQKFTITNYGPFILFKRNFAHLEYTFLHFAIKSKAERKRLADIEAKIEKVISGQEVDKNYINKCCHDQEAFLIKSGIKAIAREWDNKMLIITGPRDQIDLIDFGFEIEITVKE